MAKKSNGFRFVAFACGYVESSMTSILVYGTPFLGNRAFATRSEAITELALDLYHKFESDRSRSVSFRKKVSSCCDDAQKQDHAYCPKCGNKVQSEGFDVYGFMEFIVGLHNTDCDSYGDTLSGSTTTSSTSRPVKPEEEKPDVWPSVRIDPFDRPDVFYSPSRWHLLSSSPRWCQTRRTSRKSSRRSSATTRKIRRASGSPAPRGTQEGRRLLGGSSWVEPRSPRYRPPLLKSLHLS